MKPLVDRRILAGFLASMLLLLTLLFFSHKNIGLFQSTSQRITHTHEVLTSIEGLYAQLLEIESNQRGFIIYNNDSFELAYTEHVSIIYKDIEALQKLVGDNPVQLSYLDSLQKLINRKIRFADQIMRARAVAPDSVGVLATSLAGKRLTDSIKELTQAMKQHEKQLLHERVAAGNNTVTRFYLAYFTLCLIIILIFVGVIAVVRSKMSERYAAERAIQRKSDKIHDLYENAPCGYHSLDHQGMFLEINRTFLNWLGYSKDEVVGKLRFSDVLTEGGLQTFRENFPSFKEKGFIEGVEFELRRKDESIFHIILNSTAVYDNDGNFVQSRSNSFDITPRKKAEEKIRFLNDELEAFSFSVSHDLRAPLRAIGSYTRILDLDYSHLLDVEGKRLIGVVLQNSSRMNQLIEDLLNFSHLGRKELFKSMVDMNRLLQDLLAEMEEERKDRKINLTIDEMFRGLADKNMIRQVWQNLISNALKYTRQKEVAEISIGSERTSDGVMYYIKDNGAGFDMRYAHKLFGVFKRLHSGKEFEGTGVGLALCHRIVTRHGGKIWANADPDKGASFYFTLHTIEDTEQ